MTPIAQALTRFKSAADQVREDVFSEFHRARLKTIPPQSFTPRTVNRLARELERLAKK